MQSFLFFEKSAVKWVKVTLVISLQHCIPRTMLLTLDIKVNKAVWRTAISPRRRMTIERPQNSRINLMASKKIVTLTLSLHCWVKGSAHHLTKANIFNLNLINIIQRVQEIWTEHEIQGSNSWPLTVTLTLSRHAWVMGSAHRLTKANIWPKFHENLLKGSGAMERTIKSRMTFSCVLDLESASLSYRFYTSSH